MPDTPISGLPVAAYKPTLIIPTSDLTRVVGDRNVGITTAALLVAFKSAAALGLDYFVNEPLGGITVAGGSYTDLELYAPQSTTTDILIFSIEFKGTTVGAPVYNFQIYGGAPASANPNLLYDYAAENNKFVGLDGLGDMLFNQTLYAPAAAGSNEIWVRITNQNPSNHMFLNARIVGLEFVGNGEVLTGFVPPPPYVGPLLSTVHVGPNEQFIEPRYGMQAMQDGGTMLIDAGTYYLPFGVTDNPALAHHPNFGDNAGASPSAGAARFSGGITITGNGTYNAAPTIFNGRGGYGLAAGHPFRLSIGKGFFYANTPALVQGVLFTACGGADQTSDGEAGIYAENFASMGTLYARSCAFDLNENGMFTPSGFISGGGGVNVNVTLETCDFGYAGSNCMSNDGHAHDFYLENNEVVVINCNFYGDLDNPGGQGTNIVSTLGTGGGNNMKCRANSLVVSGGWNRRQAGRWLDRPDGGTTSITSMVFSQMAGGNDQALGYNTEKQQPMPQSDQLYDHCTFYVDRQTVFWEDSPGTAFVFSNTTQYWQSPDAAIYVNRTSNLIVQDPTAVSGDLTFAPGSTITGYPAAPPPASCPTGAVVAPLNP